MERRALGPFSISVVGVGTAPIGSTPDWVIWWGPQDEREALAAIRRALDLGVNWIDTAPFYGWGRAEEIVGAAVSGRRTDVHLFTKCGTFPDGDNLRPESVRRDLEASLRRLRTDYVDLLQFHDPTRRLRSRNRGARCTSSCARGKCGTAACPIIHPSSSSAR
jgi:aryl-alcohol dehydrogenase-like predicted oxidoreductase